MKANGCRDTNTFGGKRADRNGRELVRLRITSWKPHPGNDQLLERCEREIESCLEGCFRAGHALLIIKIKQLYLKTHDTWEDYCRERWSISRFYAHRLMAAAEVAAKLVTNGNVPAPETEAQVRPLVGLRPEMQSKVWQQAVKQAGNRPVTLEIVKTAADELSAGEAASSHVSRHRHQITADKDELLKWLDKAKLFIEQGYGDAARNILKDVLSSMDRHPEVLLGTGVSEAENDNGFG